MSDGFFSAADPTDGVSFHAARPISQTDLTPLTERVRRRLVRWFPRRGFHGADAASDMLAWDNSGFLIDASVRIAVWDRDVPGRMAGRSAVSASTSAAVTSGP